MHGHGKMASMACYLVWDFDGTLGYREGGWSGAMHEVLAGHGLAEGITPADLRAHILTGFRWHNPARAYSPAILADTWWDELDPLFTAAYVAAAKLPEEKAKELARQVRARYVLASAWRLFEDSVPALTELTRRGYVHLMLSNHVPELPHVLNLLGIREQFKSVFNSAETGFEKPHPNAFAAVMKQIGTGANAIMIGDNPTADFSGARAAGMSAILVRRETPGMTPYFANLAGLLTHLR